MLFNGEALSGERRVVEMFCGEWSRGAVVSGSTTSQAEVADTAGRQAAALHDPQGVRVDRQRDSDRLWRPEG